MSLYMFRALNAHHQEDKLYTCSIWYCHSVREFVVACRCKVLTQTVHRQATTNCLQSDSTICCMYTVYHPEDEHLRLETCRGT
jgi:hypothetical protein